MTGSTKINKYKSFLLFEQKNKYIKLIPKSLTSWGKNLMTCL